MLDRQADHHREHELLNDHWSMLDSGHWREEVTKGRIKRVRVDILLAYWLSAQRGEESSVEHLFEDLRTLLVGLENHLLTSRAEPTLPHRAASRALTIEHVMPVRCSRTSICTR